MSEPQQMLDPASTLADAFKYLEEHNAGADHAPNGRALGFARLLVSYAMQAGVEPESASDERDGTNPSADLERPSPFDAGHTGVDVAWNDMVDFLLGAGPLDGVWFGDRHPTEKGAFWWRRRFRALVTNTQESPADSRDGAERNRGANTSSWREAIEAAAKVCEDVINNGPVVTSTCWHAVASQLTHAAKAIRSLNSPIAEGRE